MVNVNPLLPPTFHLPNNAQTPFKSEKNGVFLRRDLTDIDFASLHVIIRELKSRGSDGLPLLEQLAFELSAFLGTEVKALVNDDNQFCLLWTVAV